MFKRSRFLLMAAMVLGLVGAGCGGDDDDARIDDVTVDNHAKLWLGGPAVDYTVTLYNPEHHTLSGMVMHVWLDQGDVTELEQSYEIEDCGWFDGQLEHGHCDIDDSVDVKEADGPLFHEGTASLRFVLLDDDDDQIDELRVPVELADWAG